MQPTKIDRAPAIILAGGRSLRMGRDKASLLLGKQTILEHVLTRFCPFAPTVIVVAGYRRQVNVHSDIVLLHDEQAELGPLEGIRVGLQYCRDQGHSVALVGTCDAPLVVPAAYRLMLDRLGSHDAVAPFINGQLYPLTAVYQTKLVPYIQSLVNARHLKVRSMFQDIDGLRLSEQEMRAVDPELATIANINTMDDYEALRARYQ